MFFFCLFLCQAIRRWLASSLRFIFRFLWRALCSTWKIFKFKEQFLTKSCCEKSPPWNLSKFRSEFFLVNVSRIVCWIFSFDCKLMVKLWKHLVFTVTHCKFPRSVQGSMCSLTGIQHLQIEASEKGTHTNESIMLKMCCLCEFFLFSKEVYSLFW